MAPRGDYADYIVNHQRKPGVGPLAGFCGSDGNQFGTGVPNPNQLEAYKANGSFCQHEIPAESLYFKHVNQAYQGWAVGIGLLPEASPLLLLRWCSNSILNPWPLPTRR
ncbi:MAG: hypothetical protein HRT36_04325 [Alphaproteobacteria bacterium]|nr:hypothetical protein [Alphaproteobacteria bacterium]